MGLSLYKVSMCVFMFKTWIKHSCIAKIPECLFLPNCQPTKYTNLFELLSRNLILSKLILYIFNELFNNSATAKMFLFFVQCFTFKIHFRRKYAFMASSEHQRIGCRFRFEFMTVEKERLWCNVTNAQGYNLNTK